MINLLFHVLYFVCLLTSLACMVLLMRGFRRTGMRLLLWSGLCFVLLSVNNLLVVVEVMWGPRIDLHELRILASLAAGTVLLSGFIWEAR